MERLIVLLLAALVLAVTGVGLLVWHASAQAHDERAELICLQHAQTTATIALLAPAENVDDAGRLEAMRVLGQRADECAD